MFAGASTTRPDRVNRGRIQFLVVVPRDVCERVDDGWRIVDIDPPDPPKGRERGDARIASIAVVVSGNEIDRQPRKGGSVKHFRERIERRVADMFSVIENIPKDVEPSDAVSLGDLHDPAPRLALPGKKSRVRSAVLDLEVCKK
jgi:hypothetical protein